MNLYLLRYNNYYNRVVKKEDNINDYPEPLAVILSANFNPNDGITTSHILNYDGDTPDYCIITTEDNEIVSRWFVIDAIRTRKGQYQVNLYRDTIADNYSAVANAPMYIEKATLNDNDPMIWNGESISVNQIKTNEYLLKDNSKLAWIVGYFDREYSGGDLDIIYSQPTPTEVLSEGVTLEDWINEKGSGYEISDYHLSIRAAEIIPNALVAYNKAVEVYDYILDKNNDSWIKKFFAQWTMQGGGTNDRTRHEVLDLSSLKIYGNSDYISNPILKGFNEIIDTQAVKNLLYQYTVDGHNYSQEKINNLKTYDNTIIKTSDNKFYRIKLKTTSTDVYTKVSTDKNYINETPAIKTYIGNCLIAGGNGYYGTIPDLNFSYTDLRYYLDYEEYTFSSMTIKFPDKDNRAHLFDAPYDMFCIPYNISEENIKIKLDSATDVGLIYDCPSNYVAINVAQAIAEKMGTNLYDLQLLPFCPLLSYETEDSANSFTFNKLVSTINKSEDLLTWWGPEFTFVNSNGTRFSMFFSNNSHGSFNIDFNVPIVNKKIQNECDKWRLCSPNYNGQFEFNISKNNGLTGFNVDYTYLPYSPYIHINPIFGGLYGEDFNDARGLICQGDFSISYESDAWVQYQIQNKNYANIFNRQMENMEVNQKAQRTSDIVNAITGTFTGATSGVTAGLMASGGNPFAAVGGAIVGGIASAAGGIADVAINETLRTEALNYTRDMYNYNLQNIQALPDSLAKVTAYTANNKVFPVLEYYTCTETEKKAIANKIAYNGMTVGRIGTISEFINNTWSYGDIVSKGYIKGQLIRIENFEDDFHLLKTISNELYKGVFI